MDNKYWGQLRIGTKECKKLQHFRRFEYAEKNTDVKDKIESEYRTVQKDIKNEYTYKKSINLHNFVNGNYWKAFRNI